MNVWDFLMADTSGKTTNFDWLWLLVLIAIICWTMRGWRKR